MSAMPDHLRDLLVALFGAAIDDVKVIENSWINTLHFMPLAVTRRRRIYLRGSAAEFYADPELVLHEYFHVLQQWEPGDLTVVRYIRECLRVGYWNNCFEIEARAFAAKHKAVVVAAYPSSDSRR
jgi:Domain of unknown function (DUF4157)